MELGLSLGHASNLLENKGSGHGKLQKSGLMKNIGVGGGDFCMGLSLNYCAVENQEREVSQKCQEIDDDDDGDDEISEGDGGAGHYSIGETSLQLNLLPLAPPLPRRFSDRRLWSSDNGSSENGSSAAGKGLDVNRRPGAAEEVSSAYSVGSPRSFHSSGNGNLSKREYLGNDVVEAERATSDADDDENGAALNRKKLRLSKQQSAFLEESFKEHSTLNPKQKLALAKQLNLRPRQVEVWFQNRRARTKLKQTEVDYEYMKKWCEKLSEENRRLHKELQDLRALKSSNPFHMQQPPTTLTMCPSCQRVSSSSTTTTGGGGGDEVSAGIPKAIPIPIFPLNRSRFYPFSHTPNSPNQPAPS